MGRGAGVAPDRRPEDERHPGRAGARVRRGERDAAREAGDDGPEAPGGGQARDAALGRAHDRERQGRVGRGERAPVAHPAADQREDDVLGLVQGPEGADAEVRRVVGDEEDRLHRAAGSVAGAGAGARPSAAA